MIGYLVNSASGPAKQSGSTPKSAPAQRCSRRTALATVLLLASATFLVYAPSLRNSFVNYDDPAYVTANDHVRAGLSLSNVAWAFQATVEANWHPLTWISHMADVQLFGLNPIGHHFTSLLLHAANVVSLYLLLLAATGRCLRSALVAGLFAFHPLNVETVAWVAERKSVLCTTFLLTAFWIYGRYLRRPGATRYLCVALFFGLALMAKPMAVSFPFMLLLLDYWPLARPGLGGSKLPHREFLKLVIEKIPLFVMAAGSAAITLHAQSAAGAMGSIMRLPFSWRIKNAIWVYLAYIGKGIWPAHLAVFYPHPEGSLKLTQVAIAAVALTAITVVLWRYRQRRFLLAGWFWYLATMVPVVGIVQVGRQAMADRYAYIPFLGLWVMAVWLGAEAAPRTGLSRTGRSAIAAAALLGYASSSWAQIAYWRNSYSLFSHALQVTKGNAIAEDNLGDALKEMGHPELAFSHFQAAAQIAPELSTPHYNLGTLLQIQNRLDEAKREYERALSLSSDPTEMVRAHNNLGVLLIETKQPQEAMAQFTAAIRIDPNEQNSYIGRGMIELEDGNLDRALADLLLATRISPSALASFWLGRTLEARGEFQGAAGAYQSALQLAPGMDEARNRLLAIRQKSY